MNASDLAIKNMQRPSVKLTEGKHRILIISPQPWDSIQVSKHNYARTLAAMGNTVYFLDPPGEKLSYPWVQIRTADENTHLHIVDFSLGFPYWTKFKCRMLFNRLMAWRAAAIFRACGKPDIVWDFDNTDTFIRLTDFSSAWRIFHPVDQLPKETNDDKGADVVFSVGSNILDKVTHGNAPKHFIQHGLGNAYIRLGKDVLQGLETNATANEPPIKVGYIGNLVSATVDRETTLAIVKKHPDIQFEFFGPYTSSIAIPKEATNFVKQLSDSENCRLHGRMSPEEIANQSQFIDAWLVCYDVDRDINGCCNSHKILEYLATGCVVISNRITAYDGLGLLVMPQEMNNKQLPKLFAETIQDISSHNSKSNRLKRVKFALENTYEDQIDRIQVVLESL